MPRSSLFAFLVTTALGLSLLAACDEASTGGRAPETNLPPSAENPPPPGGTSAPTPTPPTPPQGVKVTVIDAARPRADVRVLFHDATGALTDDLKTDGNGVVDAPQKSPAMVTVVGPEHDFPSRRRSLVTYGGVEQGDALVVDVTPLQKSPSARAKVDVTLPAIPPTLGGVLSTQAQIGRMCTLTVEPSEVARVLLEPSCVLKPGVVFGIALDEVGRPLAYATKKGITFPNDGSVLPTQLDPWTAPANVDLSGTNLPLEGELYYDLAAITDGNPILGFYDFGTPVSGSARFVVPPASMAAAHQAFIANDRFVNDTYSVRGVVKRQAAAGSLAISLANVLPWMSGGRVETSDKARPSASWTFDRPLAGADAVDAGFVSVEWLVSDGADFIDLRWTFVVPGNTTSVKAPALPPDLAAISPAALSASEPVLASVTFIDSGVVTTYQNAKKVPVVARAPGASDVGFALPVDDVLRVTAIGDSIQLTPEL